MARVRAVALAFLLVAALVPAAEAGTREDPNVVDATGEGDPRTDGATPLPPALDIHSAWFEPSQWTVEVHLRLRSLLLPAADNPGVYDNTRWEMQFDVNETVFTGGLCHNVTRAYVQVHFDTGEHPAGAGPHIPAKYRQGHARIGCILSDGTRSHTVGGLGNLSYDPHQGNLDTFLWADSASGEIVVEVPRSIPAHWSLDWTRVNFYHGTSLGSPEASIYQQPSPAPAPCSALPGGCPRYDDAKTVVYDTTPPGRNETI